MPSRRLARARGLGACFARAGAWLPMFFGPEQCCVRSRDWGGAGFEGELAAGGADVVAAGGP